MLNLQLSAREIAVPYSPDSERVAVFRSVRKREVRKIQSADGTREAKMTGGLTAVVRLASLAGYAPPCKLSSLIAHPRAIAHRARLAGKKGLEARYAFRVLVRNLALAPEELWRGYNRRAPCKTASPNGNTIWPPMIFTCRSFSPPNQPSAASCCCSICWENSRGPVA